jgi:vancomycin resistance protein YoaR
MLEKPDFSEYVSSSYPLEQLDNRPFLVKVRENIKEKLHKNDKEDDNRATDFQFSSSISDIKPLEAPNYTMSPTRSEVMTTSDIIDTRTDYLAQEREGRIEQAKQMLNEDLRNIHPKTETVDLNRQRLNDELSSIQPKTEKVNTGSEVLIALAQQGRGM